MNNVTLKHFQDKGFSYLSQLPINLTRYGKIVAMVVKPDGVQTTVEKKVPVPEQIVPKNSNIIGQLTNGFIPPSTSQANDTFEQLKQSVKQMENKPTEPPKSKYNLPAGYFNGKPAFKCIHGFQSGCIDCDSKIID